VVATVAVALRADVLLVVALHYSSVGFLPWCKSFATSNADITTLALTMADTTGTASNEDIMFTREEHKKIMLVQLTKPTITAIWKYATVVLDVDKSFFDGSARAKLAIFYIRIIAREKMSGNKEHTLRKEVINMYQDLAYESRFETVEKDTFVWLSAPNKRQRTGRADKTLSKNVWDDEMPPSPPPGYKPRPRPSLTGFLPSPVTVPTPGGDDAGGGNPGDDDDGTEQHGDDPADGNGNVSSDDSPNPNPNTSMEPRRSGRQCRIWPLDSVSS